MVFEIKRWEDIAENYSCTVLLGNGASMAVSQHFSYHSLLERAIQRGFLTADTQRLFKFFETKDFELILRLVWQATNVNRSLGINDERTHSAYTTVRECLIQTVQNIHPEYNEVSGFMPRIYNFLRSFGTVISLNYDLVVYWAMAYGFGVPDRHAFKDCFVHSLFSDDWQRFRMPIYGERSTTLVVYPHGNLALSRNRGEQEIKLHAQNSEGLLQTILSEWRSEQCVPLFVSEGTWSQKIESIKNSYYLSTVYREVLKEQRETLVVYGWGFSEQDLHILQRIRGTGINRIAVSVFREDQAYCNRVSQIVWDNLGPYITIEFFDSESPGCWIHPMV